MWVFYHIEQKIVHPFYFTKGKGLAPENLLSYNIDAF